MSTNNKEFQNPGKKRLLAFGVLSVISVALCLLAMSDFFTQSPFRRHYYALWILIVFNIGVFLKFYGNYAKGKKNREK